MNWPGNFCAETSITDRASKTCCLMAKHLNRKLRVSLPSGVYDFAADPNLSALDQPVFWTPHVDPAVIVLCVRPADDPTDAITSDRLARYVVSEPDRTFVRLCIRGERFDADLSGLAAGGSVGALVLLDALTDDRVCALSRFWAALAGRTVPADGRLTAQRRKRARDMLRVIDGRAAGSTYRTVGEGMFPHHDLDAASWVGSAIRETTIRLARDGLQLVRGGYRSLLRHPRRAR